VELGKLKKTINLKVVGMKAFSREIETFISDFSKEIAEENAAVFAGAGLSVGAGYVDWRSLLKPCADELGLDIEKETDLVALAQFHENENGNRSKLNRIVVEEFSASAEVTENHELLARLPISVFWTTNYDKLIEESLRKEKKIPDVKYTIKQLTQTKPGRDVVVYKMHGDVDHPSEVILTRDDYERYHKSNNMFLTALAGDLVSKTFLFIGFSFSDPNIDYILSRVRVNISSRDIRQHYALLRKVNRVDYEENADFEYAERRQEFFVKDLRRFGVKALLIDTYAQITEIIRRLYALYRVKSILISGSAHEYGERTPLEGEFLVRKISKLLVDKGRRIVSGFGLGIGSAVIAGALDEIYSGNGGSITDRMVLRPFPQGERNRAFYTEYRKDIISLSGAAIFLYGNKILDGNLVLADGVEEEFSLAVDAGVLPIPIGATGYMAEKLWQKVMASFSDYYPNNSELKEAFVKLGNKESKDVEIISALEQVLNII
jgi:hypothetical protein